MDGKTARGASSPANPALTRPEPLSHTRAVVSSSSHMFGLYWTGLLKNRQDGDTGKILVCVFQQDIHENAPFHSVYISILSAESSSTISSNIKLYQEISPVMVKSIISLF